MTRAQKKINRLFDYYTSVGKATLRVDHVITKTLFSFVVDETRITLNAGELKVLYEPIAKN